MKNIYKISFWNRHDNLVHGYSTKRVGNLSFRSGHKESVEHGRIKMADELAINWEDVLFLPLSHSNNILSLSETSQLSKDATGSYLDGGHIYVDSDVTVHNNHEWQKGIDGIVTNKKMIFPVIMSADCAAVALYDSVKKVIGFVHVGLIGAVNRIIPKAVGCMINEYGSTCDDIEVVIFPSIRRCHYDLSKSGAWKNIQKDFVNYYGFENPFLVNDSFDLQGMMFEQFAELGLKKENIFDTDLCTVCNSDMFFSNLLAIDTEAKKREGRFASIIGMKI